MKQVSEQYLDGIREGRQMLRTAGPDANVPTLAREQLKFCEDVGFWAGSGLHREFINGLRDFWRNQLKRSVAA